jgi:hypothetical protein
VRTFLELDKWGIQLVEGSEIAGSSLTDGRRVFLASKRNIIAKQGKNAIAAIAHDEIGKAGVD